MDVNPTLAMLDRLASAERALSQLGTAAAWLVALGVALAIWNTIKRRDP